MPEQPDPTNEHELQPDPSALLPVPLGVERGQFDLDQRRARAYAESGYWKDARSLAQALVRIEAGRSYGFGPAQSMSAVNIVEGRPELSADAIAALVKASGRYDYRVVELSDRECILRFFERATGEVLGESHFTMEDAKRAGLAGKVAWKAYPRNMLFARAMTNGAAWFTPDAAMGRLFSHGELRADDDRVPGLPAEVEAEVVDEPEPERARGAYDEPDPAEVAEAEALASPEELGELVHEDDGPIEGDVPWPEPDEAP